MGAIGAKLFRDCAQAEPGLQARARASSLGLGPRRGLRLGLGRGPYARGLYAKQKPFTYSIGTHHHLSISWPRHFRIA